ncbi:MAG: PAS domain-containing protein [Alphaproteobacteria bacterium]|nr:PAS domain-containing protein [Alphaproteobacteria bacterium]
MTNRHVLSRLASQADEEAVVHTFADPREAIAWSTENTPDLVVTDFKMPGMDGAEFTRQFRAQPLCYDVPVIVVTIYEDRSYRYRALEAGATDFLISPVDHQEFKARVRNFLRMRNQQKIIHRRTRSLERRLANDNLVHQEELRESREMLRQLIDAVPALVCATDRDGKVLFANSSAAKRLGTTPQDMVGMERAAGLSEGDTNRHRALDARLYDGSDDFLTFEEEISGPDGGMRTYLTVKSPLLGTEQEVTGVVTVAMDITDRKEVERVAQRQRSHLGVIIDNIPDWIYATDEEHRITLANLAFARAYHTTPDQMVGKSLGDYLDDETRVREDRDASDEVLRSGKAKDMPEVSTSDVFGERQWLQTVKLPFVSSTGAIEVLNVTTEVSAHRRAEEVLREAKDQAEAANRNKTEFLANLSHELRTPLNHIMGFAQVMAEESFGPHEDSRYRDYANNIHESGKHLLAILNDILDVSRLETGVWQLVERPTDLNRVVNSVVRIVAEKTGQAGQNLDTALADGLPDVIADERMVRQMLLNLLSNASKFTHEGGRITVSSCQDENGAIRLTVTDTGVGIAESDHETILSPFGQVENALSRTNAGTGLGLSLVKSMIEMHGGHVDIHSRLGEGAAISLVFPASRATPTGADGQAAE